MISLLRKYFPLLASFLWAILLVGLLILCPTPVWATDNASPVTDEELQVGDSLADQAFAATEMGDFVTAEKYWTELIEKFPQNPAVWSNRGNSRVSQNKLDEAIADFNQAIELAPDQADPYLNRGTALEAKGEFNAAIADYNKVLAVNPEDAFAYNNRGNAEGGLGHWTVALEDFQRATAIAPNFAFAQANTALALYELGEKEQSIQTMRRLVKKYPMFADMRAALTAVLWADGQQGEAESNWVAAVGVDSRYQNLDWVRQIRRWPPSVVSALDKFLSLS
ncbi:tetratricopeptide repeat protein [Synechocystis salina LEGE 06099]|uniref:tetratricopeptide repeat protein n=1 Tax=Synechocystis salina TaxID=945780 RepID=UPI001880C17D|nr:tetratricopeptide repeat protein [Synechocystis salina]MBE9204134.1 tetratricopeptide repeat protein [Synechocystis salina LEGE 06099]